MALRGEDTDGFECHSESHQPLKNSTLDQALAGLYECKAITDDILVFAITDDILVFGCAANDDEAVRDHDKKLVALLQRCRNKGVKLIREKLQLRLKEVAYMGHVLTPEGLQPDPEKVKAIKEMPTPTDKQSIQRLLGVTNYLQTFAPRFSEITTPLGELTKNDNEFISDDHSSWSSPGRDKDNPFYNSSPKNTLIQV